MYFEIRDIPPGATTHPLCQLSYTGTRHINVLKFKWNKNHSQDSSKIGVSGCTLDDTGSRIIHARR